MKSPQQRFAEKWKLELRSGCWLWTGCLLNSGYGQILFDGKINYAHRVSWLIHRGAIGDNHVLHKCDVPRCVNPDHLYLGNHGDNMRDMVVRGHSPRGSKQGRSKLTEAQAQQIFVSTGDRGFQDKLAAKFGVSKATISSIKHRRNWKHFTAEL